MRSNVGVFRAKDAADRAMLKAVMPLSGVVEYDDTPVFARVKPEDLTGPARRNMTLLPVRPVKGGK
jgi:hypothetical protein